jgi:hypothetical protein
VAIAPDGARIAYAAAASGQSNRIYLRSLGAADGARFLMIKDEVAGTRSNQLVVVLGWADELARRSAG